jgi:hypothetical protein
MLNHRVVVWLKKRNQVHCYFEFLSYLSYVNCQYMMSWATQHET